MELTQDTLKKLASANQAEVYQTRMALYAMGIESTAADKAAQRAAMAAFLGGELNAADPGGKDDKGNDKPPVPRYSCTVRNEIAGLLAIVGTDAEVPALAAAVKELELRESARCALDRNPSEAATDALIAALAEPGPEFRAGVVGSLGRRNSSKSLAALQTLLEDGDPEVRITALQALSGLPNAGSDDAFKKLTQADCPCARREAAKARIRLADTLAKSGDRITARRIFQEIRNSQADPAQKKAAEIGLKGM